MYVSSLLPRHKLCWLGRCCNERLRWATMARGLHCSAMILIIWDEVMDPVQSRKTHVAEHPSSEPNVGRR